jgi:hypothetical protein
MIERGVALREYRFQWPQFDAAFALGFMRALMLMLIVAGVAWLVYALVGRMGLAAKDVTTGER